MDTLGIDEISYLMGIIQEKIRIKVLDANRIGTLASFLTSIEMQNLITQSIKRNSKIVVLGASDLSKDDLLNISERYGIDKNRFEFCLEYNSIQKYNFRKLKNKNKYGLILAGPMPHSAKGKSRSSSMITEMENHPEIYPPIIRISAESTLKITKSAFEKSLENVMRKKYI